MESIFIPEDLSTAIETKPAVLVYFYNDSCAPCVALRPKIQSMVDNDFSRIELIFINTVTFPELSASTGVFASPTIIAYFDGKETFRVSKYISLQELSIKLQRYYDLIF